MKGGKPKKGAPKSQNVQKGANNLKQKILQDENKLIDQSNCIPLIEIEYRDPNVYVALLKSKEVPSIIQACDLLFNHFIRNPAFGKKHVEDGLVEVILNGPEDSYPYYNGARYRFLSKLYQMYPEARPPMEARPDWVRMAARDAVETFDVPLRAYALLYCSWLMKNSPSLMNEFVEKYGVNLFFTTFLPESDIDVKYNTLGVMEILLMSMSTTLDLIRTHDFTFKDLVDQCACPYPAIQNRALDVIIGLMSCKEEEELVHRKFILEDGLTIIFQLLNVFEWRDIHAKVLKIIRIFFLDQNNLRWVKKLKGIRRLCNYVNFILDDDLIADDLKTLLAVATTYEGKMMLLKEDSLGVFLEVLGDGSEESKIRACEGIQLHTEEVVGVDKLTKNDPTKTLVKLMLNESNSIELRSTSACTINAWVRSSTFPHVVLSDPKTFSDLVMMLKQPIQLTVNGTCALMEAISTMMVQPVYHLTALLTWPFSLYLMELLTNDDPDKKKLAQLAAEILTWTLRRHVGRDWFVGLNGICKVMKLLYSSTDHVLLNNVALMIRMAFEKDQVLADCFLKEGLLDWLLDNKVLWKHCPRLETLTETLLHCNLSLKLEYWGRLEPIDMIKDGFYCSRFVKNDGIQVCTDVSRVETSMPHPVYVVCTGGCQISFQKDFKSPLTVDSLVSKIRTSYEEPKNASIIGTPELNTYSQDRISSLREARSSRPELDVKLMVLCDDLMERTKLLPTGSQAGRYRFTMQWVKERTDLIGKTVASVMSGRSGENRCTYHTFELHIKELQIKLNKSLIPLGELEVGLKLERALLFKVLADYLGLPCALVRGLYAVGWVEVAVPHLGPVDCGDLPFEKISTNYLVDLVDNPGNLVLLNTAEAVAYCGYPMPGVLENLPRHLSELRPLWMEADEGTITRHIEIY